jgi:hypothetical protein
MNATQKAQYEYRQAKCIELKVAGYSFREIADSVGYKDERSAADACWAGLKKWGSSQAEELRALQGARMEKLWAIVYDIATQSSSKDQQLRAVQQGIGIAERTSRLYGLDAPGKQTVTVVTEDILSRELRRLEAEMEELEAVADAEPATVES